MPGMMLDEFVTDTRVPAACHISIDRRGRDINACNLGKTTHTTGFTDRKRDGQVEPEGLHVP